MKKQTRLLTILLFWSPVVLAGPLDTWTLRHPAVPPGSYQGVAFGNGIFVAAAQFGSEGVLVSTNGVAWTHHELGYGYISSVSFANGRFHIGVNYGATVYSTEGTNWTWGR